MSRETSCSSHLSSFAKRETRGRKRESETWRAVFGRLLRAAQVSACSSGRATLFPRRPKRKRASERASEIPSRGRNKKAFTWRPSGRVIDFCAARPNCVKLPSRVHTRGSRGGAFLRSREEEGASGRAPGSIARALGRRAGHLRSVALARTLEITAPAH